MKRPALRSATLTALLFGASMVTPVLQAAPGDVAPLDLGIPSGSVYATVVQPDGKMIIAGNFSSVLGVPRHSIARLNADGSLDLDFDPNADRIVYSIVVQADGKILLGGEFTTVGGSPRNYIARVDANGSLDPSFDPNANGRVYSMALQEDGKIVLGGVFTSVGGVVRNRIARVDASGALDMVFDPNANSWVQSVVVQPDGKILLGGWFTSMGGMPRNFIARVTASGELDSSFNPWLNWTVRCMVLQPDGKILIGGNFDRVENTHFSYVARLDAEGVLDLGFNPNVSTTNLSTVVTSMVLQADGKILLGGWFTSVGGMTRNRIARVDASGVLDAGFNPNAEGGNVWSVAVQADGRIQLGGTFTTVGGVERNLFAELYNDPATQILSVPHTARVEWARGGAVPEVSRVTFELSTEGGVSWSTLGAGKRISGGWEITGLNLPSSGRIRARGRTSEGGSNGSSSLIEQVAVFADLLGPPPVVAVSLANLPSNATTLTIIGENFDAVTPGNNTVVFVPSGTGIVTAATATSLTVTGISGLVPGPLSAVITTNGQNSGAAVQVGTVVGPPTVVMSAADLASNVTTLTITGENFDAMTPGNNTVVFTPSGAGMVTAATATSLTVTGVSGLTLGSLSAVVTTNGQDSGAAVQVGTVITLPGNLAPPDLGISNGTVYTTVVQPDGKTIIAGTFTSVLGMVRSRIARLNVDGTLDMGFDPNANNAIFSVALQTDGKILLGGAFTSVGGAARNRIARVDGSGALDQSFNPNANQLVYSVAVQADNRILLSGAFSSVGGATRTGIARVAPSGALDTGFYPSTNGAIFSVEVQSDGRILLGGQFTSVGGVTRNRIARLNATGDVDASFDPNANGVVHAMAVQPDGQILIGGDFTSIGGTPRNRLARVAASGTVDSLFDASVDTAVRSVAVQANGQILLGGQFTSVGGVNRNRIARIGANGVLDPGFDPNADGGTVYSVAVQADGRVLLGGTFTAVGGVARNCFAALYNDPSIQMLSVPDTSRVAWSRGGAGPEVEQVTFELSTDGGASWTPLGAGTHVTGGWEKTGLSLPADGSVRARGRTNCGNSNGSSGLIEQMANFSGVPSTSSEIAVEQPAFTGLSSGVNVSFGAVTPSSSSVAKTFTIKNTGSAQLTITSVGTTGGHSDDFIVSTTGMLTSLPATVGSTTFAVTFTPSALGSRTTTLRIVSDDGDENLFDLTLAGTGVTIADAWALDHGVSNDLSLLGVNGQANLLNFAFGLDPTVAALPALVHTGTFSGGGTIASYGQPVTAFEFNGGETEFRVLFVRRKDYLAAGLDYTPRFSGDLSFWQDGVDTPTVLADDGIYQVVSVPFPLSVDGKPGRFAVIRVSLVP